MTHPSPSLADHFVGLRTALHAQTGEVRPLGGALDAMLLTLLSLLLGRLARLARTWHADQDWSDQEEAEYADSPAYLDHSPMAFLPPNLRYVLGARRNRGMRPRARTMPIAPPRAARAPPLRKAPDPAQKSPLPLGERVG